MNKRFSGVLLHVTSLPGPFGIGTLGDEAKDFIIKLSQASFSYWQILPMGHVDMFDSPYTSTSSFAGNPLLIDPKALADQGFLDHALLESFVFKGVDYAVDYAFARYNSKRYLHIAYDTKTQAVEEEVRVFVEEHKEWIQDYAIFMVAKDLYDDLPWWKWNDIGLVNRDKETLEAFVNNYQNRIEYFYFEQYLFYKQWHDIKEFAHSKNVGIIGDVSFYVNQDSVDLWANKDYFQIDELNELKRVAGVPPDFFSSEGQLWNNPLYNWDKMAQTNYDWWMKRIEHQLDLFDLVRLDHFTAFDEYWSIEMGAETAKEGRWEEGPGLKFFAILFDKFDPEHFLAEDLGLIKDRTRALLKETGLPSMKVLQFGITPYGDGADLPHNYEYNSVTYTGTHDNTTSLGWIWSTSEEERTFILDYINFSLTRDWGKGGKNSAFCFALITEAWKTVSKIAIVPFQDICGYGEDTRMNRPGTVGLNWKYRTTLTDMYHMDWARYLKMNQRYQRDGKPPLLSKELTNE